MQLYITDGMNLKYSEKGLFPIMGSSSSPDNFAEISLDANTLSQMGIVSQESLNHYLERQRQITQSQWLYGGYLERRNLYKSSLFQSPHVENREIHLGIDIWAEAGTPIYAPIDGTVHSLSYNEGMLDYGYTLILEHSLEDKFYTLYGHLSSSIMNFWTSGVRIGAGRHIADIGEQNENGGWIPHLHFQLIIDLEGNFGDYPGVCSLDKLSHYKNNCPDPSILIEKRLNHDD